MLIKILRKIDKLFLINNISKNPEIAGYNNVNIIFSNIAKGKIIIKDLIPKYDDSDINLEEIDSIKSESLTQKFINNC